MTGVDNAGLVRCMPRQGFFRRRARLPDSSIKSHWRQKSIHNNGDEVSLLFSFPLGQPPLLIRPTPQLKASFSFLIVVITVLRFHFPPMMCIFITRAGACVLSCSCVEFLRGFVEGVKDQHFCESCRGCQVRIIVVIVTNYQIILITIN